jgi:hypothetical protein
MVVGLVLFVTLVPVGQLRVEFTAVQRVTEILDRLDGSLIGLRGQVAVEVAFAPPELLPDPRGDAGLLEEVGAVVAS